MAQVQIDRLDGLSSSTAVKGPCRVATTENITLSDLQTIDGVVLVEGDRVLVRAQTDSRDNGIYVASVGTWRRSKDFSGNRDVRRGTKVTVTDGATYATSEWICTATNPVVFDTSEIAFAQIFFSTGSDVTINAPGWITRDTLADLNTVTPDNENYGGSVLDDPDPTNNGFYYRSANTWVKGRGFPDTFAELTITGGTVDAITASVSAGVDPSVVKVFWIDIPEGDENTGSVTIDYGDGPVSAVNYDGSEFAAGEFRGRMVLSNEGASLQSLDAAAQSATAAAASETAAGDAATRAETAAAGVEYPVSYGGAQVLDATQRQQARENVHAVGYDAQMLTTSEQEQARLNIGAGYTRLAKLMSANRRITFHDPERSKIGHAVGVLPNGRIVAFYRSATTHNIADGRMEAVYSDDGGLTWSAPIVVVSEAGRDIRNYAAGVTANGVLVVMASDRNVADDGATNNRFRFFYSTDGEIFAERTGASSAAQVTVITPYGKMINRDDGSSYFRVYLWHPTASSTARYDQSLMSSSDDFASASYSLIWDGPGDTGARPSEPYTAALDGLNHVSFLRRDKSDDDTPLLMKSTNGGVTWTAPAAIANLAVGQNPPAVWYDADAEVLHAIWPSRGQLQLTGGADYTVFPWYHSSISKSQLLADGTIWRAQTPFALFSPPQEGSFSAGFPVPGGNGDSGHPHVFEAHGMRFLLYYSGAFGGGAGSDLYVANLSTLLGI